MELCCVCHACTSSFICSRVALASERAWSVEHSVCVCVRQFVCLCVCVYCTFVFEEVLMQFKLLL